MRIHRADPDRWAIVVHGFTRRGRDLDALAERLGQRGISTVAPDVGSFYWPRSTNNASYLDQVAARIADVVTGPCVLVGHSAGAAAAAHLATGLAQVRGIVFVDGNESPTKLLERAWPRIQQVPMVAICAPPNRCNRSGRFAGWAQAHGIPGCVIPGMGHGDIEGADRWMYRLACGSPGTAQTRALTLQVVTDAAEHLLDRRPLGGFPKECVAW